MSYRQAGTVLTDHLFAVPLDHGRPDGEQIEVFAREVVAADRADADLPWLLFLQGGPGFGAQRPQGRDSWLDRALNEYCCWTSAAPAGPPPLPGRRWRAWARPRPRLIT